MHANYFVNAGGATAADVRGLIAQVQRVVEERFGVRLEPEVKITGGRGDYLNHGDGRKAKGEGGTG
jgi:UDP-N-acetylmuramate dehydrogenase